MTEARPEPVQPPKEAALTRTQEKAMPEKDLAGAFDKLFYAATFITRKSMAEHKAGIERTRQLRRVRAKFDYTTSHVKEGGKIIVISGPDDRIVKSSDAAEDFKRNPQVKYLEMPNAYHATPTLKPDITIQLVSQALSN